MFFVFLLGNSFLKLNHRSQRTNFLHGLNGKMIENFPPEAGYDYIAM